MILVSVLPFARTDICAIAAINVLITLPLPVVNILEKGLSSCDFFGTTGEKLHESQFMNKIEFNMDLTPVPSIPPMTLKMFLIIPEVTSGADHDYAVAPLPGMFIHS